jgi:cytochrome c biogenesis protein CcmG/thiol:disulfide interchange protein DsbE
MRTLLGLVLVALIVLPLLTGSCQSGSDSAQIARVGKPAPDFTLPALDGQTVALSNLQSEPVMVNFWATWCSPCVHEMPYIQETYEVWSEEGLVLLAINIGESQSQVHSFMQENRLSFPVLLDGNGEVAEQYGVRGIPTSVFIDSDGVVRNIKTGSYPSRAAIEVDLKKIIP